MAEEPISGSGPEGEGRRLFQPLCQFAGQDLTFSYQRSPNGPWELLHRDDLVGIVDRSDGSIGGDAGRWTVQAKQRILGWRLSFEPSGHLQPSAIYTPRAARSGGTLALSDGTAYTFRRERRFGQAWALLDAQSRDVARLAPERDIYVPGKWIVGLGAGISEEPGDTLAVLAACFALLVHQAQRVTSTG